MPEKLSPEEQANQNPKGGNLYEPHWLMVTSGEFWRCAQGCTGLNAACWDCGIKQPHEFIEHLMQVRKYYIGNLLTELKDA